MAPSARDFLMRQPSIHCTFGAGQRDPATRAQVRDKFTVAEDGADLIIHYRSPLQLCRLYRALAERVYTLYGDTGTIREEQCRQRGDAECVFRLSFDTPPRTGDAAHG